MGTMSHGVGGGQWWNKSQAPAAPKIPTFAEFMGGSGGSGGVGYGTAEPGQGGGRGYGTPTPPPKKKAPGGGGAGGPGGTTNTAQISPYLEAALGRLEDRFDSDVTERAIGRATRGTMDAAAMAAADMGAANQARRGVSGTGVGDAWAAKRIFNPAQRLASGQAADIAMDNEKRLDALVLGSTGLVRAPDDISLANRDLALRQALGYEDVGLRQGQLDLQNRNLQNQSQQDAWSQYMAMLSMFQ